MPTPASGTISMGNMNTEILRAGGTATVDMNTIRTRFGGSGAISFSDLHDCEGFTVTCGTYTDKFISADGFLRVFNTGSVSPDEGGGMIQFAANSYLSGMSSQPAGTGSAADISFSTSTNPFDSTGITAGYAGTDVTRIVVANTARSIVGSSAIGTNFTFDMPASGTLHCLIKF